MGLFRKKPVVIEASQWFKNGDHPQDHLPIGYENPSTKDLERYDDYKQTEGKVVRYYRRPDVSGDSLCEQCGKPHHVHGWIDTLEQGHRVCPGDWIIQGIKGEYYPCKPDIFAATYEPSDEQPAAFPERDPSKPAEQQGLFRKFAIRRVDGSDAPGGKHYGCRYFVLDLNHDAHAPAAMLAYAAACKTTHPQLAADIEAEFGEQPAAQPAAIEVRRHMKSGKNYEVLMHATTENNGKDAVVYRGGDGRVWVRPATEFYEKFEVVDPAFPESEQPAAQTTVPDKILAEALKIADEVQAIKYYRNRKRCTLREAWDTVRAARTAAPSPQGGDKT